MTEEEHLSSLQYSYAIGAKHKVVEFADLLTDDDKAYIVNALVTFENSHIIANAFKDNQVAWALKEELETMLNK